MAKATHTEQHQTRVMVIEGVREALTNLAHGKKQALLAADVSAVKNTCCFSR